MAKRSDMPGKGGSARPHNMPARPQGGKPTSRQPAKSTQKNDSVTKPGSGTRGTGRGAH